MFQAWKFFGCFFTNLGVNTINDGVKFSDLDDFLRKNSTKRTIRFVFGRFLKLISNVVCLVTYVLRVYLDIT